MKKVFSIIAVFVIAISSLTVAASAATRYNTKTSWGSYTTVTLSNKSKPAYVTVKCYNTSVIANKVKLTKTNGSWLWEGTIGFNSSANMYLGNNHSAYRVYVRTLGGKGSAYVCPYSNCNAI